MQLWPAGSVAGGTGQVFSLIAKSEALVPVMANPLNRTELVPVFEIVMPRCVLNVPTFIVENVVVAGLTVIVVAGAWAVPFRVIPWGLPVALLATTRLAVCRPVVYGVDEGGIKANVTEQELPAASVAGLTGHEFEVIVNSLALVPESVKLVNVTAAVPVFVMPTPWGELVSPSVHVPKFTVNVLNESV